MNPIIERLQAQCVATPDAVAFHTLGQPTTFAQLQRLTTQMAEQLQALGVRPGQTLALRIQNPLTHLVAWLACLHRAAISCSVSGRMPWPADVDCSHWLTDHPGQAPAHMGQKVSLDPEWLQAMSRQPGTLHTASFDDPAALCRLQLSSGSTGEPKSVRLGLEALHRRTERRHALYPAAGGALTLFDMSTAPGLHMMLRPLYTGQPVHLCPQLPALWQALLHAPIVYVAGTPAQLAELALFGRQHGLKAPHLQAAISGGAGISPETLKLIQTHLCKHVVAQYSSTETGTVATADESLLQLGAGMAGRLLPDVQVDIVDETDKPVPPGTEGRVRVRTPSMALGYQRADTPGFRDGWFYPGDLGVMPGDGLLRITGRVDHVLNLGGIKLNPVLLDDLMRETPGVQDALATHSLDAQGHPVVLCAVVPGPGFHMDALRARMEAALAPAHRPRWIIETERIAMTPSGKPDRAATAADLLARLQAQGIRL